MEIKNLGQYQTNRLALLDKITSELNSKRGVVAAWLTGSLGRGRSDAISDLDLTIVLTDEAAESLCKRPFQQSSQTTPERLGLFSQFGHPALIHENHNNAPPGGTFTFVQYDDSALIVDWILIPHSKAERPQDSRLLFDKAGIPLQPAAEPLASIERARITSEKAAFFWMMASTIVKYIVREDTLLFNSWLDELHWLVKDVEGLLAGKEPIFDPKKRLPLALTAEEQKAALLGVCRRMAAMDSAIKDLGGYVWEGSISAVEKRLALA